MNEELIYQAQRMLHDRVMWWQGKAKRAKASGCSETAIDARARADAYRSACDILLAAVQGNEEVLKEFDYYAPD